MKNRSKEQLWFDILTLLAHEDEEKKEKEKPSQKSSILSGTFNSSTSWNKRSKTFIMYAARLSSEQIATHLTYLENDGFVKYKLRGNTHEYFITTKGENLVKLIRKQLEITQII